MKDLININIIAQRWEMRYKSMGCGFVSKLYVCLREAYFAVVPRPLLPGINSTAAK